MVGYRNRGSCRTVWRDKDFQENESCAEIRALPSLSSQTSPRSETATPPLSSPAATPETDSDTPRASPRGNPHSLSPLCSFGQTTIAVSPPPRQDIYLPHRLENTAILYSHRTISRSRKSSSSVCESRKNCLKCHKNNPDSGFVCAQIQNRIAVP